MNLLTIAPAIMAGVGFFVGFYHLLIYSRLKQRRFNLTFALTCFFVGIYDFFTAGLYLSTTVAEGMWWGRAQIVTIQIFAIAFLQFTHDYTQVKPGKVTYGFYAFYGISTILSILNPWNMLQDPSIPRIRALKFEYGFEITYNEVGSGPLSTIQGLVLIAGFCYITWIIFKYTRGGHPKEARPLFVVIALFFVGAFNDSAIIVGLYPGIYLLEYSYIFMVIFMTYTISKTVVDAAGLEQALRESEARYRHIVEGMSDGLGVIDKDGKITFANDPLCKILGYKRDSLLGYKLYELLDVGNQQILENERRQRKKGKVGPFELEWTGADGHKIPTLISAAFLFDNEQHFAGSIAVITDITERKRAEETLKKLYEETLKISEMKSNLITFVSHELKTPLVPIIGWSDLLKKGVNEGLDLNKLIDKEGVEGIVRSSYRLSAIINNFLDLDRLERDSIRLEKDDFPLLTLLDNALKEIKDFAQIKRITIKNTCENVILHVDGFRIEQVFINILSNAVKYSPPNTTVEISSQTENMLFHVYFQDEGYGFTTEDLHDIWQPFTTVYLRKKDTLSTGTGIGLRLSKGIIEQHKGSIEISSPGPNQGSLVKITFPLKDEAGSL